MRINAALVSMALATNFTVATGSLAAGGDSRPRIGIALGGGSARGLAHIGVLQWIDENRIPVDYVAGTSIGAIIGSLYAMGESPEKIRERLRNVDWDQIFAGDLPYELKEFRRKEDRRDYPVRLELGLKGGVRLPSGLESGHGFGLLIDSVTLPYSNLDTFDELPIPFRCTATDMLSGDPIVLNDGSLPQAIRASMAVPGVFTPVSRDGRVLADGGLLNNVPADIVRSQGAQVVIAVDVGSKPSDRTYFDSFAAVLDQSINIMILARTRQVLAAADIVIAPDLKEVGPTDWRRSDWIADMGYSAASDKARFLKSLSLSEDEWREHLAARMSRVRKPPDQIQFITISDTGPRSQESIARRLGKFIGEPLDKSKLETELTMIAGSGRYESVGYESIRRDSRNGLLIRAREKDYGPPFVRLLFRTTNARDGAVDLIFGGRLTMFDAGLANSEFRLDVVVGGEQHYAAEYFYRPGRKGWFLRPRGFYDNRIQNLFVEGARVADYKVERFGAVVAAGYEFSHNSQLSAGYRFARLDARVRAGDPLLPAVQGFYGGPELEWIYNRLDSAMIPTRGLTVRSNLRLVQDSPGTDRDFWQGDLSFSGFQPIGKRHVVFARLAGGRTLEGTPPLAYEYRLGGPFRLGAWDLDEFRGDHFVYASPGYMRKIGRLPDFFGGNVFLGAAAEVGSTYQRWAEADFKVCATGGILLESPLGPLFLGASWGEGARWRLNFTLGGALIPDPVSFH